MRSQLHMTIFCERANSAHQRLAAFLRSIAEQGKALTNNSGIPEGQTVAQTVDYPVNPLWLLDTAAVSTHNTANGCRISIASAIRYASA